MKTLYEITGRITDANTLLVNKAEIDELRTENEAVRRANLDCVDHFNQMQEELAALQTQKHIGLVVNEYEVGLCAEVTVGSKVYAAAGAAPVPNGWIVVKQHVYEPHEGAKKQLGYLVPEGMVVFPSFADAHELIAECELPLGWVCLKVSQLLAASPKEPS